MDGAANIETPHSPLLDEEALMAIINEVWGQPSPRGSPSEPFQVSYQGARVNAATTARRDSADSSPSLNNKPKKTRRRDRNRPWHEITRLKEEAAELQRELQERATKASKRARYSLQNYTTNAELKTILRDTLNAIHALEQNVLTQMGELVQDLPHLLVARTQNLPYVMTQDDSVFIMMARRLDDQYMGMAQALRLAGLGTSTSEVTDATIFQSNSVTNNCGAVLKSRARILSPFQSDSLLDALWTYLEHCEGVTMDSNRSRDLSLPLGIASRVTVQKYEVALGDYVCTMRMVVKQFVEKNRTVHVWIVLADWVHVGALHNVKTYETGWGFIQPVRNGTASVCLSYSLVNLTVDGYPPSENYEAIKSLLKLYHRFMISRLQTVENQTLDQLIQNSKQAPQIKD